MRLTKFVLSPAIGLLFLFALQWAAAQAPSNDRKLSVDKAIDAITLDGVLDEASWQKADRAANFVQQFPYDTALAVVRTEAMVTYDDQNLYIAAFCYDQNPGNYTVQSLKRDFSYPVTDAFAVYIAPFQDKTNGFSFAVSPLGVQREGLIQNGGGFGVSTSWDNRWFSEVAINEAGWTVEIKIPFKTLRYKSEASVWDVNFSRNSLKDNENSVWSPVPRNFNVATLNFCGEMRWDSPPPKAGANVSLIPYALGGYSADYENGTEEFVPNAGVDAKISVTSALNLDLTVNPDFSQVEVDRQVTNLDRFSLFFPERRQFFIENSDLFDNFGFSRIRPFFSRRIGLNSGQAVPILAGARLSGKLNQNWRIGLLNMQTEGVSDLDLAPQNYTAAVVQRQVLTRSNVTGIFVNRQGFDGNSPSNADYNRIAGLEFNFLSADNRFRGKAFWQQNFDDEGGPRKSANAIWARYQDLNWTIDYNHEFVEDNFNAEVGFVPRQGYLRLEPIVTRRFYPKKGPIMFHGPQAYFSWFWDNRSWENIEQQSRLRYSFTWKNRAELNVGVEDWFVFLQNPFDPSRTGLPPLPAETGYHWNAVTASYASDFRKLLNYSAYGSYGGFYAGSKFTLGGEVNYRVQPWGIFSLAFEQNNIQLTDTSVSLSLISPRFEFAFTRSLFFTTFLQYNTQTQNFNVNARLQWRFKPMSDLFVVLTDNYFTENLGVRNRAFVVKLNYWFTL